MDSDSSTSIIVRSAFEHKSGSDSVSDLGLLKHANSIPKEFIWPKEDLVHAHEELNEPVVDLEGFLKGDEVATQHAAELIRSACLSHGFFQVVNGGVDVELLNVTREHVKAFFELPVSKKLMAKKKMLGGSLWGYSSAHADRYSTKLTWSEYISFGFREKGSESMVKDYFQSAFGKEMEEMGMVFQKYSESMRKLSLVIMEILAISLGVDRFYYKNFFEDGSAIVRLNNYPPCPEPARVLGTGPHSDPTSLTILHQDEVGGLEVFVNKKWLSVRPIKDALVINIGDTFQALSNGVYKSCVHRAVVNSYMDRMSVVFFLSPREDKVVKPPEDLLSRSEEPRNYPDFTWSDFFEFTQNHYRVDVNTLQNFTAWLLSSKVPKY